MRHFSALLLLSAMSSSIGCIPGGGMTQVAAPVAPTARLPDGLDPLPLPPAAGLSRFVLDANGERATVTEVLDWSDSQTIASGTSVWVRDHGERSRPICITPCEFDFEPGLHVLRFSVGPSRFDQVKVQVGGKGKLVRVALGHVNPSSDVDATGPILQYLGGLTATVGASLLAASLADPGAGQDKYQSTGIALTLGGGAGLLAGIALAYRKPGTFQPSTVTEVSLPLEGARP